MPIAMPSWLLRLYLFQLPKPEELSPQAQTFFYVGALLGGILWTIWLVNKKGLRMFATGVSVADFERAVAEGRKEHDQIKAECNKAWQTMNEDLKEMRDRSDERLAAVIDKFNSLDKQVATNIQQINQSREDIKDLERKAGRRR